MGKLHAALLKSGGDVRRSTEVELWGVIGDSEK